MTTATTPTVSTSHALRFPFVTAGGREISHINLRRARAKDILAFEETAKSGASDTAVTIAFIASINEMHPEDLGNLDAEDLLELGELVTNFLPAKLKAAPEK